STLAICLVVGALITPHTRPTRLANSGADGARTAHTRYDGKTLFRGFYFGRGPVTALFPEYYRNIPASNDKEVEVQERYVSEIDRALPTFFATFQKQLYSANQVKVSAAFKDASAVL